MIADCWPTASQCLCVKYNENCWVTLSHLLANSQPTAGRQTINDKIFSLYHLFFFCFSSIIYNVYNQQIFKRRWVKSYQPHKDDCDWNMEIKVGTSCPVFVMTFLHHLICFRSWTVNYLWRIRLMVPVFPVRL